MSGSLTCSKLAFFTISAVIIQTIAVALFLFGFFPVKPALPGTSGPESFRAPGDEFVGNELERDLSPDELKSLYRELSGIQPVYDRLILMVIDGLPAEFVLGKDGSPPSKTFSQAMPYTQSLLANGMAIGYHAKAAPPTVTMPRLKAMVSGAIGGFLDVAFNFNTQALLDDNLLDQFFKIGWKMVMLGDETWIKLFPKLFARHDGVGSFFVKDTVEVDRNVSRHLGDELRREDWNLLILHYLGLDHVGHIGGRSSFLMPPKLTEMDEVIKMIHLHTIVPRNNNQGNTLLVVVSDHGMTENGNHGGSSYEEIDSLALFIGLRSSVSDYVSATSNAAYQVDIAPTLALLYGVPIPKNSVGVMLSAILDSLTDDQRLRALELNSWQILRLVKAQLPGLSCGNSSSAEFPKNQINKCSSDMESMLCCLYMNATVLHSSWKSGNTSRSSSQKLLSSTVAAYFEFLRTASEWLSRRATDKPFNLLAFGVTAMLVSCVILLRLLYCMCQEVYSEVRQQSNSKKSMHIWCLDDYFTLGITLLVVISMASSSLVEEEQYIWHFLTSTLSLLLVRKTLQSLPARGVKGIIYLLKGQNGSNSQLLSVLMLLVSGRILRGWHQGGVNWTYLPDISKCLEQAGASYVKAFQLLSGILVTSTSLFVLFSYNAKRKFDLVIGFSILTSGLLVLRHNWKYHDNLVLESSPGATLSAQIIYAVLCIITIGTVLASPWLTPRRNGNLSASAHLKHSKEPLLIELGDCAYMIGSTYLHIWCLLQLLLQQPINAVPIFLLILQLLAIMLYALNSGQHHKFWVEVALLYYLGMAGHFALGNTNTLATIDVAGAFIGISNHSTLLSGILMFIITYASPLLSLLSIVMYMSVKTMNYSATPKEDSTCFLKRLLGLPCLIPLSLNSIILTAYTVIFLMMRNHLFVWSVFSPKYLYVCAATVCVYIGVSLVAASIVYIYLVLARRQRMQKSITNNRKTI